MNLHIFNPEHDIALACNKRRFTAPHAAQELRMNLGWIPALWASDGDMVLVDDVEYAIKAASRFKNKKAEVLYVTDTEIRNAKYDSVIPWGWDKAIKTRLLDAGIGNEIIPSENVMENLRQFSNRKQTINALKYLRAGNESVTCGEAYSVDSLSQVAEIVSSGAHIVVKAPWSSSGRGVRYVENVVTPSVQGFLKNVIREQGNVMVEPYYNKVKDFGMEFESMTDGSVVYRGLSLFQTRNGAYTGNLIAHEKDKMELLSRYIEPRLLDEIKERACHYFMELLKGLYQGPFGVDMMIVAKDDESGYLLHPCVEINLRRTMGHVALDITPEIPVPHKLMHIDHEVNYILRVSPLENPFVKVL